jgi:N-acetylglucosamine-6-phosphate deacetylase
VRDQGAFLDDNTLAGSTATMDRVFRVLTSIGGLGFVDAATICATTPARELGLTGHGLIAPGAVADLVVLGPQLTVVETYIAGRPCLCRA